MTVQAQNSEVALLPVTTLLAGPGPITVPMSLPEGLIGCEMWQTFTLEMNAELAPLMLLHCQDQENLSFIVADPRIVVPDYRLQLAPGDWEALGQPSPDMLAMLVILNPVMHGQQSTVTANLLGPVVFNRETGQGRQIIQPDYSANHPVGEGAPC